MTDPAQEMWEGRGSTESHKTLTKKCLKILPCNPPKILGGSFGAFSLLEGDEM